MGKTFPVKVGIVGDAQKVVQMLREQLPARKIEPEYLDKIKEAKVKYNSILEQDRQNLNKPINPGLIIQSLRKHVPDNAIICSDVGDHTYWFYKRFVCTNQTTLLCANMAGMGFGIPAAIASQFAEPKKMVVAVTGDGGFGMAGMEFTTAVQNRLPIKIVVFNDGKLKNIMKEQEEYGFPEYKVSFPNPDFSQLANSAGGFGIRVTEPEFLDEAFKKAFASPLPAIIDVKIDPDRYIQAVHGL